MIKTNRRNVGKNQMIYSHHTNRYIVTCSGTFSSMEHGFNQRAREQGFNQITKHFLFYLVFDIIKSESWEF